MALKKGKGKGKDKDPDKPPQIRKLKETKDWEVPNEEEEEQMEMGSTAQDQLTIQNFEQKLAEQLKMEAAFPEDGDEQEETPPPKDTKRRLKKLKSKVRDGDAGETKTRQKGMPTGGSKQTKEQEIQEPKRKRRRGTDTEAPDDDQPEVPEVKSKGKKKPKKHADDDDEKDDEEEKTPPPEKEVLR